MSKHTQSDAKRKAPRGENAAKTYKGWTHVPQGAFAVLYSNLFRRKIPLRADAQFLLGLIVADSVNRQIGAEYPLDRVFDQEEYPLLDGPKAVRRAASRIAEAGLVDYDPDTGIVTIPDSTYALVEGSRPFALGAAL